jgi:hypothetical protein
VMDDAEQALHSAVLGAIFVRLPTHPAPLLLSTVSRPLFTYHCFPCETVTATVITAPSALPQVT